MALLLLLPFPSPSITSLPSHLHKQPAHVDPDRHVVHQLLEDLALGRAAVRRSAPCRRERRQGGAELGDLPAGLGGALGAVRLVRGGRGVVRAAASGRREGVAVSRGRHREKRSREQERERGRRASERGNSKSEITKLSSLLHFDRTSQLSSPLPRLVSSLHRTMDARAACLRSRSIAIGSCRGSSRRAVEAAKRAPLLLLRRRGSIVVSTNANANDAENDLDLDLLSALAPPDIDGDVASAYADAGARFDVSIFFFPTEKLKQK